MYKIYLCGGMTGVSEEEQKHWRKAVQNEVCQYVPRSSVEFFDPTEYGDIQSNYFPNGQEAEEISMKLDLRKLSDADLVICNISSNPASVGTNMELGIAHNLQIPVVMYNPDNSELHPWQRAISDFQTNDLALLSEIVAEYYLHKS